MDDLLDAEEYLHHPSLISGGALVGSRENSAYWSTGIQGNIIAARLNGILLPLWSVETVQLCEATIARNDQIRCAVGS